MLISDFQRQCLQKLQEIIEEQREQMQRPTLSILAPVHNEEEFTMPLDSVEELDNMCTKLCDDKLFRKNMVCFDLCLYQIIFSFYDHSC